jgi:hypothetical protein
MGFIIDIHVNLNAMKTLLRAIPTGWETTRAISSVLEKNFHALKVETWFCKY